MPGRGVFTEEELILWRFQRVFSRESPGCGKQRRIRPFFRDSRECRDFRDSRVSSSEKTPFIMTPSWRTFRIFLIFFGSVAGKRRKRPSRRWGAVFTENIGEGGGGYPRRRGGGQVQRGFPQGGGVG